MTTGLHLNLLSAEEVGNMYDKCLHLLSTKGIKILHQEALKALDKGGAQVDFENERVRFPVDMIEEALRTVPKSVTLAGQIEENDITLPDPKGLFFVHTATGSPNYITPDSYHPTTLTDVAEWGQLASVLEEINVTGFLSPQDVPEATSDIHGLKTVLENTTKHIIIQPYTAEAVKYLLELGLTAAGSKEALKDRMIISIFACTVPPFVFDTVHSEVVLQASRLGVPIYANPLSNAGATSPITIAGTVLQNGVEVLGKLVMSQIFQPGTPVIARPIFFTLDMLTGRLLQSSFEAIMGGAAVVQFIKEAFHIPTNTWGFGSDSYIPDGQAIVDVLTRGLLVSLSGGDLLAGAGQLNNGIADSPVQLMIDNKITKVLKRVKQGIKVDDDYLAWKEILDTEPGGHYLELAHTLKHCREALRTGLSVTQPRDTWLAEGGKGLHTRIAEDYRELKKKLVPRQLPEDVKKELSRVVKHADEHLVK